ncbi:MAG: hypothetical protein Q4Q04_01695 [Methanocorpusculum sp.]|nr:hypothetical protein [Methanocorpusculum sp.]
MKKQTKIVLSILIILILVLAVLFLPFQTGSSPGTSPLFTIQEKTVIIPSENMTPAKLSIPDELYAYQFAVFSNLSTEQPEKLTLPITIRGTNCTAVLTRTNVFEGAAEYSGFIPEIPGSKLTIVPAGTNSVAAVIELGNDTITVRPLPASSENTSGTLYHLLYSDKENTRFSIFGAVYSFIGNSITAGKEILVTHLIFVPAEAPANQTVTPFAETVLTTYPAIAESLASGKTNINVYADSGRIPAGSLAESEFQKLIGQVQDTYISFENTTYQIRRGVVY